VDSKEGAGKMEKPIDWDLRAAGRSVLRKDEHSNAGNDREEARGKTEKTYVHTANNSGYTRITDLNCKPRTYSNLSVIQDRKRRGAGRAKRIG